MPAETADRLLRLAEVLSLTGLSRSSIYRMIGQRAFPAPLKIGTCAVGWRQSELLAWLEDRPRV